jgi:glycosyltransferase involved in cell wall biosynthesis
MRVELLTSYFFPFTGGIENVVLHLADGLSRRGHTVVVHTGNRYPGSIKELPALEKYNNFIIKRYPIYQFSLFFPKLEFTDSVISLHNYSALMNDYVTRRYRKQKKIMTPYGTVTYNRSQRRYPFFSYFYDALIGTQSLFSMDKIIAMTDFEKKSIIKKYPHFQNKTIMIPGGIDIVRPKKFTKSALPPKYFFSIGRIAKSKRFENVLSVLAKFPSYHYLLAGSDTGYLKELEKIAQKEKVSDRFHFLGKVTDQEKAFLMQHSDVFIMPSSAEAFSIASVEAFCYSRKVVGAKSGGIVDVFQDLDGELYTAEDISSLTTSLKKIVKSSVSQAVLSKRKSIIQKKYTWDVIVKEYEKAFFK